MTNVVIVNRKGVQLRDRVGRFAPKIVPPAQATTIGPGKGPTGTNKVVQVDRGQTRSTGQGVATPPAAPGEPAPRYRVVSSKGGS